MFSNFPKHSVLNLQFIYIPTDKLDLDKALYCVKATAAIPTALGDIKHLSKEFYFMIDHEQVTAIGKSLNISSNLTLKEKIIKPLSNISANSIYYILDSSKVSKGIAYQLLVYLGLKLPYDVDSLNSFKKYLNKNLLGRRKMIKKILPLFAIFAITLVASIVDTTIDQKNYYTPQREESEEDVSIEYYCLKDNTILVIFGETEMPVVWNNKRTGKLENLKCEDFKEWAISENILDNLEVAENGER